SRWYPMETVAVRLDRSALPALLKTETPLDMTVEGVGLQVVGTLREVAREQFLARRFDLHTDLGGYLDGDQVGHDGVENWQEERLRGKRGYETRYLDSGRQEARRPQPGQ